jgi:hypothetical protein
MQIKTSVETKYLTVNKRYYVRDSVIPRSSTAAIGVLIKWSKLMPKSKCYKLNAKFLSVTMIKI